MREAFANGLQAGGKSHPVEILVKDSQSNPNRAAEVANELILSDEIDMMLVASTPETTNPVSDQCEVNEIPCVSTVAPWQPWFFTRGGDPAEGFEYTYHFFWGLEDVIAVFTNMWDKVGTNKKVGGLFPNDGDGNAWGDENLGFPKPLAAKGYSLNDPGRYQNGTDDFSAYISSFKAEGCEVVTGVMIPPDFTTFWTQARQQGFVPRLPPSARRSCFRWRWRRWARWATTCPRRSGGRRTTRSPLRSPASRPGSWPRPTRRPPASSGPSPSASCTRCSRSPRRPSTPPAAPGMRRCWSRRWRA